MEITPAASQELELAWRLAADKVLDIPHDTPAGIDPLPEQFMILITCRNERQQVELLERFIGEGLECRALLS